MSECYPNLAAVAKAHGVSGAAVTGWTKKGTWPIATGAELDKSVIDRFVMEWVVPNRKGRPKPSAAIPPVAPSAPAAQTHPPTPISVDLETASLEDLELSIRRASSTDVAEKLSKQVRALKVVREIQERDGITIDARRANAEIRSVLHHFQVAITNVPRQVAPLLEGLTAAECEKVLDGRLTEILGELKRGLERSVAGKVDPPAVGGSGERPGGAGAIEAQPDGGAVQGPEPEAE